MVDFFISITITMIFTLLLIRHSISNIKRITKRDCKCKSQAEHLANGLFNVDL